jgi:hypothetical protein
MQNLKYAVSMVRTMQPTNPEVTVSLKVDSCHIFEMR